MKKSIIFILTACALAGCASRQEIATDDDATCRSYGAEPGSQAYIQCRMQRDALRQQDRTARAAAILSSPGPVFEVPGGPQPRF